MGKMNKDYRIKKFMSDAADLANFEKDIQNAGTYKEAKIAAEKMFRYIDCLYSLNKTAMSVEGSFDIDGDEVSKVLMGWNARGYQALGNKAKATRQKRALIAELFKSSDYFRRFE